MYTKVIEFNNGDELFCSKDAFDTELSLGECVTLNKGFKVTANHYIMQDVSAIVIEVIKSNSEKKQWQFWMKQEVIGYMLRVIKEN